MTTFMPPSYHQTRAVCSVLGELDAVLIARPTASFDGERG
jgi:hypothetical protein